MKQHRNRAHCASRASVVLVALGAIVGGQASADTTSPTPAVSPPTAPVPAAGAPAATPAPPHKSVTAAPPVPPRSSASPPPN